MDSISAIVPVYNRFDFLEECLDSVFRQTRVPDEVLVVDDCSTGSVDGFLSRTPFGKRVRVLKTDRNRRVSGARNWGWKHACGSLITFLDSDDVWEPYKTELQLRHLSQHPEADGVYGAMAAFFPSGDAHPWAHDRPPAVSVPSALADGNISVQTLMIHRDALERVGGFDEGFGILDDQDIAIRLARQGSAIHFLADPAVARLRRHSANHSSNPRLYFDEDLRINRKHGSLIEEVYGPGSRRVHLARAVRRYGSQVRYLGALSRATAWLLGHSAPRSTMPRRGTLTQAGAGQGSALAGQPG